MYHSAASVSCFPKHVALPHSEENCNSATLWFVTCTDVPILTFMTQFFLYRLRKNSMRKLREVMGEPKQRFVVKEFYVGDASFQRYGPPGWV
jgi:hypothetical protein